MKYYLQIEGKEKLVIKVILVFLLLIIILLTKIAFTEEVIYVDFSDEQLINLCQNE